MAIDFKRRGWIRVSPRHPEKVQRAALEAAGCGAIYMDGPDSIADLLASLRKPPKGKPGDTVVVTTLGRLAATRRHLMGIIDDINAVGATVVETATGYSSGDAKQAMKMVANAVAEITGDARAPSPEDARKRGSKGGKAKRKSAAAKRTARQVALGPWRDLSMSPEAALATEEMVGWTKSTAYRHLKKRNTARGVKIGRPRKPT